MVLPSVMFDGPEELIILFLGCTTPTKVFQYELSVRWVARNLGIELVGLEDFTCCGSNQINLISATGAVPIEYGTLLFCCGGKTFLNCQDLAFSLIQIKLENLQDKAVDCITLHCNSCYLMYGLQQPRVSEKFGKSYHLPVLLYPQLLGLALGADPIADLGLHLNIPSTEGLLKRIT